MRKVTLGLALASTAIAVPASARDGQWYVGLEGGVALAEDQEFEVNGVDDGYETETDLGYDVDAIVGYDFGMFRLEAEAAYKSFDQDELTTNNVGVPGFPGDTTFGFTGNTDINGQVSALSFMGNALLDFGDDDGIQGFVGAGAGIARVKAKGEFFGTELIDDSDSSFAWQALAGFRVPLTDNLDAGLKYRFFNVENLDYVDNFGNDSETKLRSHSALISLVYNFGGEEEVEPAPVVTPPPVVTPTQPPVATCRTGPYIVYFDWDESTLTSSATGVLDNAVAQYANCGSAQVMLAGHADKSGSATYNVGLSERRNASVQGYLVSKGVPQGRISSQGYGESRPAVDTPDGVREPKNRRVEVTYGPGSGN